MTVYQRGYHQHPELVRGDSELISTFRRGIEPRIPGGEGYAAMFLRRAEYASDQGLRKKMGLCPEDFYLRAAELLDPAIPIFVVSDDDDASIGLVQQLASRGYRAFAETSVDYLDKLGRLAGARQTVLANSTFSWWPAVCGEARKVIYPDPWFTIPQPAVDPLYFDDWIPLSRDAADPVGAHFPS